jgi:hypothetical protein
MLRGSIDDQLNMTVTLTAEDLCALEQKSSVYGTMRRPVSKEKSERSRPQRREDNPFASEDVRDYVRRAPKPKPLPAAAATHVDVPLTLYLKSIFRVSGYSASAAYHHKNTYDVEITPQQVRDLRQKCKLEYRDRIPCNSLTIVLEDAPARPAVTQSL